MEVRQLLPDITAAPPEPTPSLLVSADRSSCSVLNLPVEGILSLPNGDIFTLTAAAVFKPACTSISTPAIIANGGGGTVAIAESEGSMPTEDGPQYSDFRDPFYASTFPQCYALAATTVVAYTLVIMLFATPRSFLDGGVVVLGRKGFTNGGTGTSIGGRPWLQKVAALSVAVSLTIATAATFHAAEVQYSFGIQNAKTLQEDVLGGNELKIIRIISNTFLWLAQAQTLIRLFPRQREKVIIKWTAFALITLDVIFQSLNSFQYTNQGATRPRTFTDAVPALSYLFALALGVLYAAWVIYYSLMKKRYAFYHPQMKNMILVAVLSLLAILVPVVFFILDISKPDFTGWGDYVRWVGAAAASVIVWEWVERIEALEREEKKDGILGREVFDGDEMLEVTPTDRARSRRRKKGPDDTDHGRGRSGRHNDTQTTGRSNIWPTVTSITSRYRSDSRSRRTEKPGEPANTQSTNNDRIRFLQPPLWPARPAPAVTPVSRTDTASAASTIYAIRYHPLTETTSRTTPPPPLTDNRPMSRRGSSASSHHSDDGSTSTGPEAPAQPAQTTQTAREIETSRDIALSGSRWRALAQGLLSRHTRHVDEERVILEEKVPISEIAAQEDSSKWDIRMRLEEFAVAQAEKFREKIRPTPDTDSLPVTVIPAPPRRGAALARLLEEEELGSHRSSSRPDHGRRNSSGSRTLPTGEESLPTSPTSPVHRAINGTGSYTAPGRRANKRSNMGC
ncbi:PalH/RIM21-domain-containing protein [Lasiosphaeris hirsuta]|uniref:PalH/RIM21-domain-containing protein n=1 Tax=Lasiosphaeris hirsuta TaxID=260670 RepID=A0AA40A8T3_9PEZI|nr:PalH/RIM21-domain-containing protein [Lasiosphaeris hirsuta]